MNNAKTLTQISKESGLSVARLRTVVKDLPVVIRLGNSVGYDETSVKDALYASIQDVVEYLNLSSEDHVSSVAEAAYAQGLASASNGE